MLVSVGRGAAGRGPRPRGDRRRARPAQGHRRRRAPPHDRPAHLRGRRLRRLLAARAHGLPRGRGRRRERDAATRPSSTTAGAAADLHRSGDRRRRPDGGRGARAVRRRRRDGQFPWVANARAVMQNETIGWVKSIHETRYGELLGIVMVGPHVTDLIEAGVVAIDAEATVETVADGMAAHPTLSEAIKEAGLVALGRAIHLPPKKRRAGAYRADHAAHSSTVTSGSDGRRRGAAMGRPDAVQKPSPWPKRRRQLPPAGSARRPNKRYGLPCAPRSAKGSSSAGLRDEQCSATRPHRRAEAQCPAGRDKTPNKGAIPWTADAPAEGADLVSGERATIEAWPARVGDALLPPALDGSFRTSRGSRGGGPARAWARAGRQARLERGPVGAVPGGARGSGARAG